MLYRVRKKGVRCDTRGRTIFWMDGKPICNMPLIQVLVDEFGFCIQLVFC